MSSQTPEPEIDIQQVEALLAEAVSCSLQPVELQPTTRAQLMDLLDVPRGPVNRSAYQWDDIGPGLKSHLLSQDVQRGVKKYLVWGRPGAATPRHGHSGDEVILVLEGQLRDNRGSYGPGDICRSTSSDVHQEQVEGNADCVCFVVYYGDLIPV